MHTGYGKGVNKRDNSASRCAPKVDGHTLYLQFYKTCDRAALEDARGCSRMPEDARATQASLPSVLSTYAVNYVFKDDAFKWVVDVPACMHIHLCIYKLVDSIGVLRCVAVYEIAFASSMIPTGYESARVLGNGEKHFERFHAIRFRRVQPPTSLIQRGFLLKFKNPPTTFRRAKYFDDRSVNKLRLRQQLLLS